MAENTPTREELEEMDEDQLKALASSRGITVTARDGSGTPSVDDYVDHLAPPDEPFGGDEAEDEDVRAGDERARKAQERTNRPAKRIDETVPGGRYINARGRSVNAAGQELDKGGKPIDAKDQEYPDSPE